MLVGSNNADSYGDDGDPYAYGGGYDDLGPKWFEHGSVTESRINNIQSINCVAFDPFEEVLWTGLQSGRTVSYLMPTMEKYTAFGIFKIASNHLLSSLSFSSLLLLIICGYHCILLVYFHYSHNPLFCLSLYFYCYHILDPAKVHVWERHVRSWWIKRA